MKLCSDILYESLSSRLSVERRGNLHQTLSLNPPVFYYAGTLYQDDMVYVGRVGEMPMPPAEVACLIVCVGGRMPSDWHPRRCCIFSVGSEADILLVFNILQEAFIRYSTWSDEVVHILDTTADFEEIIRITADLFDASITFLNKYLQIVVNTAPSSDMAPQPQLSPEEVRRFAASHKKNIALRESFAYEFNGRTSYDRNVYIHGVYQGLMNIERRSGDLTESFKLLSDYFFDYLKNALQRNMDSGNGKLITMKSIFSDLLENLPVSKAKLEDAQVEDNTTCWVCAVIRSIGVMANVPMEYFCLQLEQRFEGSYALVNSPYIVLFVPCAQRAGDRRRRETMEAALTEMDLRAGLSFPFEDALKARSYFRQAVITLELALRRGADGVVYDFRDYVMAYALENSIGEFNPEFMVPEEIRQLRAMGAEGVDYWGTLRIYLDNEMNTSETARELFIHRTTLQARLRRIEKTIDLGTAASRMYIRYCIRLCDLFDSIE